MPTTVSIGPKMDSGNFPRPPRLPLFPFDGSVSTVCPDPAMAESPPDILRLTDFVDLATLQEIQDSVAAVKAVITDAEGAALTQAGPTTSFLRRQKALAEVAGEEVPPAAAPEGPQREGAVYVAPIIVNDKRVGMIRMSSNGSLGVDEAKLTVLAEKFGLEPRQVRQLVSQWLRS